MRLIVPIVEGEGEEFSVPHLLWRWFAHRNLGTYRTQERAIVSGGCGTLKCGYDKYHQRGIEYYVELAMADDPDGILVILDSDDECQPGNPAAGVKKLGPRLLERARNAVGHDLTEVAVVVAHREFEAWFLASLPAYCNGKLLPKEAFLPADFDCEALRGCKEQLSELMGHKYSPTADQHRFVDKLPFDPALADKVSSFGKLLRDLHRLTPPVEEDLPPLPGDVPAVGPAVA